VTVLKVLENEDASRARRDRLELLTALMMAPGFDPLYRSDLIAIPPQHPVYGWECVVEACGRVKKDNDGLCQEHRLEWREAREAGSSRAAFLTAASPWPAAAMPPARCMICPDRPSRLRCVPLCGTHHGRWRHAGYPRNEALQEWLCEQTPFPGYGECQVEACPDPAVADAGLCHCHEQRYAKDGRPGGARGPKSPDGPIQDSGKAEFLQWCAMAAPAYRQGLINLRGLRPLIKAEIQWGLHQHAQIKKRAAWELSCIQRVADLSRTSEIASLAEFADIGCPGLARFGEGYASHIRMTFLEIANGLRCIYYTPADAKDAGYLETDHFGRRFHHTSSYFCLTGVSQRWLRDLLWEHLAEILRSPQCPRSRGPLDESRRACVELSAFLEIDAPGGGHDPRALRAEHAQRFLADQRNRHLHGLKSLGMVRAGGKPSLVTDGTLQGVFNYGRRVMFWALETGHADQIGLDRGFITAFPAAGRRSPRRSRSPFTDDVTRALAEEANLRELDKLDPNDSGLRDAWEAIVYTGRRCSEILRLKVDCIGRYHGLPMLWHDQTKVGNYDEGIRIPEYLYARIDVRRRKTLTRFEHRHGRHPAPGERTRIALFPTRVRNPAEEESISYGFFNNRFREWLDGLDLGGNVAHQARHTLATKLLAAGASLAHIRKYLGHVSDRMAEHYAKVSHSDLDDLLSAVWVAGPGSASPGELLSGNAAPISRQEAMTLALDLSRRSTPAEGGFCTWQPVVDGGACPWNLDCANCDKFVLSGADLLYWRRKQEQWRSLAERAPTDEVADFLHKAFEPTARAIEGLEKALAGLGLLDQALALDLRRPQDYFQRIWAVNFRASDLTGLTDPEGRAG
jgi:integrase